MIRKYIALLIIPALAACGGPGRKPKKEEEVTQQAIQPLPKSKFYPFLAMDNSGFPFGARPGATADEVMKRLDTMEMTVDVQDQISFALAPDLKGDDEMVIDYFLDSKGEKVDLISVTLSLTSEDLTKELFDDLEAFYTYKAGKPESDDIDDWLSKDWVLGEEEIPVHLELITFLNQHMVMLLIGNPE